MAHDPTTQEMTSHLTSTFAGLIDFSESGTEFDIAEAIYWFASNYHGGQWSNLYSSLSTSEYRPGPCTRGPEEGSQAELLYQELESKFGQS